MAKQQNTEAVSATTKTRALKKVTARQIILADEPVGYEFEGRFVALTPSQYVDKKTGEEKTMYTLIVEQENGDRLKMLADAGLRTALADAVVVQGDWFKAVKLEKINIGGGRTMNQWDLYQFAN